MKDDPAFPCEELRTYEVDLDPMGGVETRNYRHPLPGLTKRELIAAMAMQGLVSSELALMQAKNIIGYLE